MACIHFILDMCNLTNFWMIQIKIIDSFGLPSWTSIPSCLSKSLNRKISSLSSRINLAFASSLMIALQTICLARSAYLNLTTLYRFKTYFVLNSFKIKKKKHNNSIDISFVPQCWKCFIIVDICWRYCCNHSRLGIATKVFTKDPC